MSDDDAKDVLAKADIKNRICRQVQQQIREKLMAGSKSVTVMPTRVLSLDGGGLRALSQLEILASIESLAGKKIVELFDVIVGTGTGAMLAVGLRMGMDIKQLAAVVTLMSSEIFGGSRLLYFVPRAIRYLTSNGWYDDKALKGLFDKYMHGTTGFSSLAEPGKPTVTCVSAAEDKTCLFSTNTSGQSSDELTKIICDISTISVSQVLMASFALFKYFGRTVVDIGGSMRHFMDGARVSNNPVFKADGEARRGKAAASTRLIVSIGAGESKTSRSAYTSAIHLNKITEIDQYSQHEHEAFAAFVQARAAAAEMRGDDKRRQPTAMGGSAIQYQRFNVPNICHIPYECSDDAELKQLKEAGQKYVAQADTRERLQSVVDILLGRVDTFSAVPLTILEGTAMFVTGNPTVVVSSTLSSPGPAASPASP